MTSKPAFLNPGLFMEQIIGFLLPHFATCTADPGIARQEVLDALASYGARTRAEMLAAAQVIAFGLAALETLREATSPDMSATLRLRYRSSANSLNRSCQVSEKSLARQLGSDVVGPEPLPEPANNVADVASDTVIRQAQAAIQGRCANRHHLATPQANPNSVKHNRVWGGAMMDALAAMGMPVQPVPATPITPS